MSFIIFVNRPLTNYQKLKKKKRTWIGVGIDRCRDQIKIRINFVQFNWLNKNFHWTKLVYLALLPDQGNPHLHFSIFIFVSLINQDLQLWKLHINVLPRTTPQILNVSMILMSQSTTKKNWEAQSPCKIHQAWTDFKRSLITLNSQSESEKSMNLEIFQ
jgi:hypothetical protein